MVVKKIAVLRANGLGDFIFVLPALQALRARYPEAEIVYLGKSLHRQLLADRPSPVDRVVELPPIAGVGEAEDFPEDQARVEACCEALRREHFDLALQLHGGGRYSNRFLKRLEPALSVGLKTPDALALDISLPYLTFYSEVLRYLEVVATLGAHPPALRPRLAVTDADLAAARAALPDLGQRQFVLIHPGATDRRRHWPTENFSRLADHLAARGLLVCVGGQGEEEGRIAGELIAGMRQAEAAIDLSNRLSLAALIGLLASARLMLSNDSGPLHLGQALGVPAVGIFLACNMINAMPMGVARCRPLVSWITDCPLCGAPMESLDDTSRCSHDISFAAGVSPAAAIEAVDALLELEPADPWLHRNSSCEDMSLQKS